MGKRILIIGKFLLKLFVFLVVLGGFTVDYIDTDDTDKYLHYSYGFVMFVCSFSFLSTFFARYRKVAYIVFFCSFAVYLLMNKIPPIKIVHDSIACLETGQGVWDYEQNICRSDCWHWDREHGCYKEVPKEQ